MPPKRRPEEESPQAAALKKRCRSFDLEIRGCRHLQELAAGCVRTLEAALESAISRIPEEVTKALTSFLIRAPRTLSDQNQPPRYKLRFSNGLSNEVFTKKGICDVNGESLKISVHVNNPQEACSHRLLSAKIRVVVLDGDFNKNDQGCWTSEEFRNHIVRPRDKVGTVLTGELELSLKNGEAYIHDATFVDNSKFMRSGKFRLGVMVIDDLGERIQEGITEPFVVKDRRGEGSKKHEIPSLDDDVWRLKKISKDGVFHDALKQSGISNVKEFLRLYYTDEPALRKILIKATDKVWTTIIEHAKKCDPGRELYSFLPENRNVVLFFNSIHQIVGVITGDHYTPFSDLDKSMQDDVGQLSKLAYADLNHFLPDFEMKNGKPRQINQCAFQESRMVEPKFTDQIQGHMDPNFAGLIQGNMDQKKRNVHESDDQQGTSGSHPRQCKLSRFGSVRVTHVASLNKNDEDSLDFSFLLNSLSDQHDASMNTNEIAASVTFHCPTASTNEITGSVVMRQASFRIDHPACENDASVAEFHQEQQVVTAQFDPSFLAVLADAPMYSTHNSFKESECHEALQKLSED
ncbi:protein SAR DEFICIENT 1 isoform X2 [Oryza sativa Japonica Group]|uniref:Os12g0556200 protein n=2 Tax=Oryza sativa subsp. japonica TaxID=39947 RepID=A3CIC6_ORYSJ|nr:calmodulin-binding protein 60 B isoform X2 [Oryza sativa Japonica Group]KAB8117800.1 hypothetical protein EE612_060208 [Oryza sativa]ABA99554.2 calmodulin-binding protein, putative, expressed [Oryza sativa Japonica Group]EAZ20839.1 hypothetical protein OsJ_36475 [Oryza sativa Japonica Group]KAF2908295.1 hypothetical protein DAI22_12g174400 [Oryza sativa Japonica Group]BAF30020.1 Os12g0556200 [Oryza sativa Japonica Group]|eukprot:NP_001067001.1 Os12g0556200 [Oryza sativa Japonica Group]